MAMTFGAFALLAAIFGALPIVVLRAQARSPEALLSWPESWFTDLSMQREGQPSANRVVRRFGGGYPWTLTISAGPAAMFGLVWFVAAVMEVKELAKAAFAGEFAAPLLLAFFVTLARSIAFFVQSGAALSREARGVVYATALGAAIDTALVLTPLQVSDSRSADRIAGALGLALSISLAAVFAIEHARRRDRDFSATK